MGTPREVVRGGEGYPERLASLRRPPPRLFLEGPWQHDGRVVAVVGSRHANGDGLDLAHWLAAELAESGVAVISGMAHGIDAAAHEGALSAGGKSGAVLGTPLDRVYPREHDDLQRRLAASLGIVSEFPPGTPPTPHTFASRNRTLAGLADAVVVVQGREGSGACLTAQAALEFGRPLAAIPWDPREPLGEAPLQLLVRKEAALIRHAGDLLDLLAGLPSGRRPGPERIHPSEWPDHHDLTEHERRLLAALRRLPEPLEQAAARAGLSLPDAGAALVVLELLGRADRSPGGRVRRTRPSAKAGA